MKSSSGLITIVVMTLLYYVIEACSRHKSLTKKSYKLQIVGRWPPMRLANFPADDKHNVNPLTSLTSEVLADGNFCQSKSHPWLPNTCQYKVLPYLPPFGRNYVPCNLTPVAFHHAHGARRIDNGLVVVFRRFDN